MPRVVRLTFLVLVLAANACWGQQGGYADRAAYREPAAGSYDSDRANSYRESTQPSYGAEQAAPRREPAQPAFDPFAEAPRYPTRPAQPVQLPSEAEPAALPAAAQQAAELTQPTQPAASYAEPVVFQNSTETAQQPGRSAVEPAGLEVVEQEPRPLRPATPEKSLPLAPPSKLSSKGDGNRGTPSLVTLLTSLTLVLGLFSVAAWVVKRGMPKGMNLLPAAAVEVLGRIPIAARQQAYLVRIGGKMILVSATPGGMETLTEITDPVEVDRLAGICQQSGKHSSSREFKQILQEFDSEPAPKTFIGASAAPQIDFSSLGAINTSSGRGGRHG